MNSEQDEQNINTTKVFPAARASRTLKANKTRQLKRSCHLAFQAVFSTVQDDKPSFKVGKTLIAIVLDWSDQQLKGLEAVIGEETTAKVVKGCQVHFTRSVKRVSERINKGNPLAHRAFTTIAYTIPKATSRKDVLLLFNILAGDTSIDKAFSLCKGSSTLKTYAKSHQASVWKTCHHWASWWVQPKHLRKYQFLGITLLLKMNIYLQVCLPPAVQK